MFSQKEMSRYPKFIPNKLYRCPCLTYVINQIYDADIRNFGLILDYLSNMPCFAFLPSGEN